MIKIEELTTIVQQFFSIFNNITYKNVLDIGIITFIFYKITTLVKDTKAEQLVKGFVLIFVVMQVSQIFGFIALTWIIQSTLNFGVIAFIIIFQPEFRKILGHIGEATFSNRKKEQNEDEYINIINNIERAVFELSRTKTGALIVVARKHRLNEITKKGTPLDATVTYALLINAFVDGTPLHDGAIIIQDERVVAGNCVLPLTEQIISNEYGTRHRAALGISETTDSVSIIVSEETGNISICESGKLKTYSDRIKFRAALSKLLIENKTNTIEKKVKWWKKINQK